MGVNWRTSGHFLRKTGAKMVGRMTGLEHVRRVAFSSAPNTLHAVLESGTREKGQLRYFFAPVAARVLFSTVRAGTGWDASHSGVEGQP